MSTRINGLEHEPFGTEGTASVFIETPPMREALAMMHEVYRDAKGLGMLSGLAGSGRRTVLEQFTSRLQREDISAVVVDGNGMDRVTLLRTVLSRIGYQLDSVAPDDMSGMLRVFLVHQCHAEQPAFLSFLNVGGMRPSALEEICRIAEITAGTAHAARIVLACDDRLARIVEAPAMGAVRDRITARCRLRPLDLIETDDYIVRHLRAAGARSHSEFLTDGAIAVIWRASGGLPGDIEAMTLQVLRELDLPADTQAVQELLGVEPDLVADDLVERDTGEEEAPRHTRLVVSLGGRVMDDRHWPSGRVLIGRDSHNDLSMPSRYVSRHHALLVLENDQAWVADLKSVNGTYVNSRRVSHTLLTHGDVVSIGNHRVKYLNPAASHADAQERPVMTETTVMRSLRDVRHLFAVADASEETVIQRVHTGTDARAGD